MVILSLPDEVLALVALHLVALGAGCGATATTHACRNANDNE